MSDGSINITYKIGDCSDRDFHVIWTGEELNRRFWIDIPVNTIMEGKKLMRMELPRSLAKYIFDLREEVHCLEMEVKRLKN